METSITHKFGTERPGMVIYSCAGRLRSLPEAAVLDIGQAIAAAPIPFSPNFFEGIVETDGVVSAQIDLNQAMGAAAGAGRYSLLVRTGAGLVRLRVDSVSLSETAPDETVPPGLAEIETLTRGFAPAEPETERRPVLPAIGTEVKGLEVLIAKCGGTLIAIPASTVELIERHQGARHPRKGHAAARLISLDGDILPGWSMATWLGRVAPGETVEDENWAVVVRIDGHRSVLAVAGVLRVVPVPFDRLRRLRHQDSLAVWLLDPDHGMIEVIDPAEFGSTQGRTAPATDWIPDAAMATAPVGAERRTAVRGQLAVRFGAFTCIVPGTMIADILGGIGPERIAATRTRTTCPLFDPARLLGLPAIGAKATSVMMVNRPGRRALALRMPGLGPAATTPDWHPLPMVPPPVRSLFQAVRLHDSVCELLVRDTAFGRVRDPALTGLLKTAHRGWLGAS